MNDRDQGTGIRDQGSEGVKTDSCSPAPDREEKMRVILKARGLCKSHLNGSRELTVLKGLDLTVRKGEMVFVVGHSGVGKSTLLHLLGALDRPTAGEVRLDGMDIYRLKDKERARLRNEKIGFVFQFYHLLPGFSAWENVMMPMLIAVKSLPGRANRTQTGPSPGRRKSAVLKERAVNMLKEVGLGERLNHRPGQLSGGEGQRVAIARALINDPDIVLADEPTGNLDEANSRSIMQLIRRLNRRREQTVVIATHQEALAEKGDRLIRIINGKAVEEGR